MPSGGARKKSGPAPDPMSLRSLKRRQLGLPMTPGDGLVTLSRSPEVEAPAWPLPSPTVRELELWAEQWLRPQAAVWVRNGSAVEVALFVRTLFRVEGGTESAAMDGVLMRRMESLLLTEGSLTRAGYQISANVPSAEAPDEPDGSGRQPMQSSWGRLAAVPSSRDRLRREIPDQRGRLRAPAAETES